MMEHKNDATNPEQPQQEVYTPRPAWQVWLARIALVLFIGLIILYYLGIATGGLL